MSEGSRAATQTPRPQGEASVQNNRGPEYGIESATGESGKAHGTAGPPPHGSAQSATDPGTSLSKGAAGREDTKRFLPNSSGENEVPDHGLHVPPGRKARLQKAVEPETELPDPTRAYAHLRALAAEFPA